MKDGQVGMTGATNQMFRRLLQPGGGVTFLGLAAIAYGIACFLHGDFAIFWQPVPESLPLRQPLAYLSAILLVLGGAGLLIARTLRPATMLLLPLYLILIKLSLINSYLGVIVIYSATALPFCIWQLKGYYDTIPLSLEEAAGIDGCTRWQSFYRIVLPLSAPAIVITALFSFMTAWNEYVVSALVLQDVEIFTLPVGLKTFQSNMSTQWGLYAAGALFVSIPVVVLFLLLSRYLISGLSSGAVKG